MKLKLDENLPARLVEALRALGHDADSVPIEGLSGAVDAAVWQAAQREDRFLITQDLDFSDAQRFRPGTHAGLLLVRLREPGAAALMQRLIAVFSEADVESWARCFVVLSDYKLRVRRPADDSRRD